MFRANKEIGKINPNLNLTLISSGSRRGSIYSRQNSGLLSNDRSMLGALQKGAFNSKVTNQLQSDDGDNQLLGPLLNGTEKTKNDQFELCEMISKPKNWSELLRTLWLADESRVLRLQNPDGFFYLLYLKRCSQFFSVLSIWNMLVLLPSYTILHDSKFSYILPEVNSPMDYLTLADSLLNPQIVWLVLLLTFLYSSFAFYTIIVQFGKQMSNYEFPPSQQYLDNFISSHSIMIRGINQNIGVDDANHMIRRMFEERFGQKQVISVHTIRRTENVQELFHKREIYRHRYEQYRMQNNFQDGQREMLNLGTRFNSSKVDAENYYLEKLNAVQAEWNFLKSRQSQENSGLSFVSFRDKNCVQETIEEIDIVKIELSDKDQRYDFLDLREWEIEEAIPMNDIIWGELNVGRRLPGIFKLLISFVLPFFVSLVAASMILIVDQQICQVFPESIQLIIKYISPIILALFSYWIISKLIFRIVQKAEHHERKSQKEESLMSKNIQFMIISSLLMPFIITSFFSLLDFHYAKSNPYEDAPKSPDRIPNEVQSVIVALFTNKVDNQFNEFISMTIATSHEFFLRYTLQMCLLVILFQILLSPDRVLKAFHQTVTTGSKTKFKHWFYDIGFKIAVAVSFFTFALFFSITVPILPPIATLVFLLAYYIDKYNLIYVYPIDFESKITNRKALIVYSIVGIIIFQILMFTVASSVLSKRVSVYLIAFLLIEIMVLITTFEFIRKPWEGKELQIEQLIQEQANNLYESISSMHTINNNIPVPSVQISGRREFEAQTHAQKVEILSKAYENPFEAYFNEVVEDHDTSMQQINQNIGSPDIQLPSNWISPKPRASLFKKSMTAQANDKYAVNYDASNTSMDEESLIVGLLNRENPGSFLNIPSQDRQYNRRNTEEFRKAQGQPII